VEHLGQARKTPSQEPEVDDILEAIQSLVPLINAFFDDVLVMAPDPTVRSNRLGLVQQVASLTQGVFDPTRLEGF
jgi:glycyl-tRNA synthetase beta subunit